MQFQRDHDPHTYNIRAYAPGKISITAPLSSHEDGGPMEVETIQGSCIITPRQVMADWPPQGIEDLAAEHLAALVELDPEVIILGTGETLQFPAPRLGAALVERQIGLEIMDTAAACRTYNILVAEGRMVVAALMNPPA
jgi:uncharacterized protein